MPYALKDPKDGEAPAWRAIADPRDAVTGEAVVEERPKDGEVWDDATLDLRPRTEAEILEAKKAQKVDEIATAAIDSTRRERRRLALLPSGPGRAAQALSGLSRGLSRGRGRQALRGRGGMTGNVRRRLEDLEERARQRRPEPRSADARRRMREHLERAAELRRGGATVENNAELAGMVAATGRRREIRGEGRT